MRVAARLLTLVPLVLAPPALAQRHASQPQAFGSSWFEHGDTRETRLTFETVRIETPDPLLYRPIEYDWHSSSLQSGLYPAAAFAGREEGTVRLRIAVDAAGKPSACEVSGSSGIAALDAHSCPHVLAHVRFFPALDRSGARVGGIVSASLSYRLKIYVEGPSDRPPSAQPAREAAPEAAVTLATLGISHATPKPAEGGGITALLQVDREGSVVACDLIGATQVDALDKQICDRLIAVRFTPALDAAGTPIASVHPVAVEWR